MKIRMKLFNLTGIIFLGVIAISIFAIVTLNEITLLKETTSKGINLITRLREIHGYIKDFMFGILSPSLYHHIKDVLYVERIEGAHRDMIQGLETFEKEFKTFMSSSNLGNLLINEDIKVKYNLALEKGRKTFARIGDMRKILDKIRNLGVIGNENLYQLIMTMEDESLRTFFEAVRDVSYNLTIDFVRLLKDFVDDLHEQSKNLQQITFILFLASTSFIGLIVIIFSLIFSNRISNRIKSVETAIRKVSYGDFDVKLKINTKDEFGTLAKNFDFFIQELTNNIDSILTFMQSVSESISNTFNINIVAQLITESISNITKADSAVILFIDKEKNQLMPLSVKGNFPIPIYDPEEADPNNMQFFSMNKPISFSNEKMLFNNIITNNTRFFAKYTNNDSRLVNHTKDNKYHITSIVALPLVTSKKTIGVISVIKKEPDSFFTHLDYTHAQSFSDYASLILDNLEKYLQLVQKEKLERELDIAAEIQKNIVPKSVNLSGYEVTSYMQTAAEVGGDVFDLLQTKQGTYIAIGDASGHGLPAGLLALIQQASFQACVYASEYISTPLQPHEIYNIANKVLCELNSKRIKSDKFMTQNYLFEKKGKFTHAGSHEIGILYLKNDKKIQELEGLAGKTGYMGLSYLLDATDSKGDFKMDKGDILLLYTDGLIEAMNKQKEQFGIERVKQIINKYSDYKVETIRDKIIEELDKHLNEIENEHKYKDDVTFLMFKKR